EVLGTKYQNGVTVHRVITPYRTGFCPHARAALLSGNTFRKAKLIASGLRAMHETGSDFFRLRRGFMAWLVGTRSEQGDTRLHQFVRAIEAVIKPAQGRTREEFVSRCSLFAANGDILDELYD